MRHPLNRSSNEKVALTSERCHFSKIVIEKYKKKGSANSNHHIDYAAVTLICNDMKF